MSRQQREQVDALLREAPFDVGGEVDEQRRVFAEMIAAIPVPEDVSTRPGELGGVAVTHVETAGAGGPGAVLYLHGGGYAIGSAASSVGLASELARRAGVPAISVDYRLAPEHPYPAALDDAVAAYAALLDELGPRQVVVAGESAGAGLVAAMLVALRARGLPQPAAALLMSPWADLTLSGESVTAKAAVDPALTADGLRRRAGDYLAGAGADHTDPTDPLVSPVFADLTGLPPLLVQAGTHEILLDDATRLAANAARADVAVTLDVTPEVPHVFQGFAATLDEGAAALDRAGAFIRARLDVSGAPIPPDDPTRAGVHVRADDDGVSHLSVVGDTYTVLVAGAQTAGRYTLIDMWVPPGGGPPPHRHDFEEMFTVLEGEIEVTLREQTSTARAGDTVNVPANAPHRFTNAAAAPARLLCMCTPAGQEEFFAAVGVPVASRTAPPPALTEAEQHALIERAAALARRYRTELLV